MMQNLISTVAGYLPELRKRPRKFTQLEDAQHNAIKLLEAENERLAKKLDQSIDQHDACRSSLAEAMEARDVAYASRDYFEYRRDRMIAQRDEAIVERDEAIAERDGARKERDRAFSQRNTTLAQLRGSRDASKSASRRASSLRAELTEAERKIEVLAQELNKARDFASPL